MAYISYMEQSENDMILNLLDIWNNNLADENDLLLINARHSNYIQNLIIDDHVTWDHNNSSILYVLPSYQSNFVDDARGYRSIVFCGDVIRYMDYDNIRDLSSRSYNPPVVLSSRTECASEKIFTLVVDYLSDPDVTWDDLEVHLKLLEYDASSIKTIRDYASMYAVCFQTSNEFSVLHSRHDMHKLLCKSMIIPPLYHDPFSDVKMDLNTLI